MAALGSWSHLPIPLALGCPESSVKLWLLCPASLGARLVVPSEYLASACAEDAAMLVGRKRSLWIQPRGPEQRARQASWEKRGQDVGVLG